MRWSERLPRKRVIFVEYVRWPGDSKQPAKVAFPDSSQSTMRGIPFFVEGERNTRNGVQAVDRPTFYQII